MAGYTRQSAADIVSGQVIKAEPVHNEFEQLVAAFSASTGHRHDGTSTGEGGLIPLISDTNQYSKVVVDTANNRISFYTNVGNAAVEQVRLQDGAFVPVTDEDIDLGSSSAEFKDLYIDGVGYIDTLAIHENATITGNLTVNGNTTLGSDDSDTVTVNADVASDLIPSADGTYDLGSATAEWQDLHLDGTANIDSLVADTADINGGTIDATVIGGTTPAAADFTTMDASGNSTVGGTFGVTGNTTLSGTLGVTGVSTFSDTVCAPNLKATGTSTLSTVDINAGNIDGTVIGASSAAAGSFTTVSTTGQGTFASVDINGGNIDGVIGASTRGAGNFTTMDATGNAGVDGNLEVDGAATVGSIVNMSGGLDNAVTDITVNGVSIISAQVAWRTSNSATAEALADAINDFASAPEYEATATGADVNIISKESGSSFNNFVIVVTVSGNVTTAFSPTTQNFLDGGATSNNINGYTPGGFIRPVKTKMYALSDSLLHFSGTNDPTEWNDGSAGAGFINLSNNASGSEDLQSMANYFDNIAVFAKQAIQIWFVSADESLNQQIQVLNNTGTIAPQPVVEFGDNDVFYLSVSGVRSLRARDSSNAAFVGDIGNPIDETVISAIASDVDNGEEAQGILDPRTGRYLLAIGSTVYVFSYFPSSKVSAWSTYEPGFAVDRWAYAGAQILCRSGNNLFSLGGTDGNIYDNATVEIQMPFLDAGTPATNKDFTGIDVTCTNEWDVSLSTDPTDISLSEIVATVNRTTYGLGRVSLVGYSTHVAPKLTCSKAGQAKLGNISIHYEGSEAG